MNKKTPVCFLLLILTVSYVSYAQSKPTEVESLAELVKLAAKDSQNIRMKPGVYALEDFLTERNLEELIASFPPKTEEQKRPPRWFIRLAGDRNTFDFTGVNFEINTELYAKLPYGYTRCIFIDGDGVTLKGLTIKNTGPENLGSNGNILSIFGSNVLMEDVSVYVCGSSPYGYGDLFGKGGPNLTSTKKQSGIMVAGRNNTLRGCKVFSRAFGHCFYIQTQGQETHDILMENCYAEGVMRKTDEMLSETSGLARELNYQSVYQNRDGRYMITPGYTKSLSEDGFRTYGGVGQVTLRNCIAVNTRAGFEIGGSKDQSNRTILEGCQARGTERAFLLGSNVYVRNCRGDMQYGPLLYLRENTVGADVELELIPGMPKSQVHAVATIAGKNHRVRLFTNDPQAPVPALPVLLGFGMPAHAEMSSPIFPMETDGVVLVNEIDRLPIIKSDSAINLHITTPDADILNSETQKLRGEWQENAIHRISTSGRSDTARR